MSGISPAPPGQHARRAPAWLAAAPRVTSDYERRRTLEAMLTCDTLDDRQLGSVVEDSASIGPITSAAKCPMAWCA